MSTPVSHDFDENETKAPHLQLVHGSQIWRPMYYFGATYVVVVSILAFLACHQCYSTDLSLVWGLSFWALVCHFLKHVVRVFFQVVQFPPGFFAISECRVHNASSLQVRSQATVSRLQPEYSGLLMLLMSNELQGYIFVNQNMLAKPTK